MIYMKCKCGSSEFFGSGMEPNRCEPCNKCGSIPARGPNSHPDPVPHNFVAYPIREADQEGATVTRCSICMRTKREIEKNE